MRIGNTIFKATLLATSLFWLVIMANDFELMMLPFALLSLLPVSICCSIVIFLTIVPFFWHEGQRRKKRKQIFKTFFPYYAITSFSLCLYGTLNTPHLLCFYTAAYFTSLQSWVWSAT